MKAYLLFFFLFAALVLGSYMVGPLSVRVYFSLLFFWVLFRSKLNKQPSRIKEFTKLFNIFLIVTALTLLLNGEFMTSNFIKKFLAYYFPALLTIYGVSNYIKSFSDTRRILLFLLGVGVFTASVTWLQYFGVSAGTTIGMKFINVNQAQNDILETLDVVPSGGAYGSGMAIGIMGFAFTNACFISSVGAIPYVFRNYRFFYGSTYLVYAFIFLMLAACFMTQERSSFFSLLAIDLFLIGGFYPSTGNGKNRFLLIFIAVVLLLFYKSLSGVDMGRLTEFSAKEDTRNAIWKECFAFLSKHWLLGGPVAYNRLNDSIPPHNYFLNEFINSGLIGGLLASYIYIRLWISTLRTAWRRNISNETRTVACCLIVSLFYSLFHNATFAEGDVLQTLLCIMHIKNLGFEEKKQQVQNVLMS
jgi:hypothetical protein